jgi:Tol biopolymer transport system component
MTAGVCPLTALAALFVLHGSPAIAGETELISVGVSTKAAIGASALRGADTMSADGRYVVFQSARYGLVYGDTNRLADIFVRDRWLGMTRRVSVASDGTQSNGHSDAPAISPDGRYVVFQSTASNLVPGSGDPNGWVNIYLHDTVTRRTELVSMASSGGYSDEGSYEPTVSGDGRYVAFMSTSTNLVAGYTGGERSVYVRDRQAGRTELINAGYAYSISISRDGRYVAFDTDGRDLMYQNVFVRDRATGVRELIGVTPSGSPGVYGAASPTISADGRYVAFSSWSYDLVANDSNGYWDIFVRDRQLKSTSRVSLDSEGRQLPRGGQPGSFSPAISADGRYVTFVSEDSLVVPEDTNGGSDAFVRDTWLQRTLLVTVRSDGRQVSSDDLPITCAISADGRYVAFDSYAPGFVSNDLNVEQDVFVHDLAGDTGSTDPTFTLKPQALDFGDQPVGSTTVRNAYLNNTGDVPLSVTGVRVRGDDAAMFSATHQCGNQVAVGAGCAIKVRYAPAAPGSHSATLVVVVGGDIRRYRALSGVGFVP